MSPAQQPEQPDNPSQQRMVKGGTARAIADDAPLVEGSVTFEGIVRPVKGGYDVRGVAFDEPEFRRWMAATTNDGIPKDAEWFLGARVRVVAVLVQHRPAPPHDGPAMQTRGGMFFSASRIGEIVLVKNAETIEGELGRSKGMFTLAGHLITPGDLAWSLSPTGGKAGDRVRLRGQSRTYVCPTDAQCLIGGSLPMFDVAQADRLP